LATASGMLRKMAGTPAVAEVYSSL
jgi:hypothetical protein